MHHFFSESQQITEPVRKYNKTDVVIKEKIDEGLSKSIETLQDQLNESTFIKMISR